MWLCPCCSCCECLGFSASECPRTAQVGRNPSLQPPRVISAHMAQHCGWFWDISVMESPLLSGQPAPVCVTCRVRKFFPVLQVPISLRSVIPCCAHEGITCPSPNVQSWLGRHRVSGGGDCLEMKRCRLHPHLLSLPSIML